MQMCSAKGVKRLNMKRNTHFPQIQPSAIDESIGNDALLQKHAFNIPHSPFPISVSQSKPGTHPFDVDDDEHPTKTS